MQEINPYQTPDGASDQQQPIPLGTSVQRPQNKPMTIHRLMYASAVICGLVAAYIWITAMDIPSSAVASSFRSALMMTILATINAVAGTVWLVRTIRAREAKASPSTDNGR